MRHRCCARGYRHTRLISERQAALSDHLVLEGGSQCCPIDRIAIAMGGDTKTENGEPALASPLLGIAIWANVSKDVDQKIQEQVREGVFPVKMAAQDWNSGDIVWLLDVVAPSRQIAQTVLANFRRVLKAQKIDLPDGQIRLHPVIKRTLGEDALKSMGAMTMKEASALEEAEGQNLH